MSAELTVERSFTIPVKVESLPPNFVGYTEVGSFQEAAELIGKHESCLPFFDLDNTIRMQSNTLRTGRIGEIPYEAFLYMQERLVSGEEFVVETDQWKSGLLGKIARFMATLRDYPFYPDSLIQAIGEERIHGRTEEMPGNKLSPERLAFSAEYIQKMSEKRPISIVPVVGDRDKDIIFAVKLAEMVPELPFEAYKVPDPFYIIQNRRVRRMLNKVIP